MSRTTLRDTAKKLLRDWRRPQLRGAAAGGPSLRLWLNGKRHARAALQKTGGPTTQAIKSAISLAFHLMAVMMRLLRRVAGRPTRHRLVILYYHAVPPTLRTRSARQLDMLAARAPVVPADYHGPAARDRLGVAITFNDALTSVLDNAVPELRARQMPATIFVPAGSLSGPPRWEMDGTPTYGGDGVAAADALRGVTA